jgi:hypothetical protein
MKGKRFDPWSKTRGRRVTAAAVAAGAAVVVAVVTLGDWFQDVTNDPAGKVHVRILDPPQDDDLWIAPASRTRGEHPPPIPAGGCRESDIRARAKWFVDHGGVPAAFQSFQVQVINDSDKTLVVDGLRIEHLDALEPVIGPSDDLCPGEGGPFEIQYATINLDRRPLNFEYHDASFRRIPAVDFAPEPHRPLEFYVQANASKHRYRWTAVLDYTLEGREHHIPIGDPRKPFDLSGCSIPRGTC